MFTRGYLLREDGVDIWLGVQDRLEGSLRAEAHPGQVITVLTMSVGGTYHGVKTWLFLVNEFDTGK